MVTHLKLPFLQKSKQMVNKLSTKIIIIIISVTLELLIIDNCNKTTIMVCLSHHLSSLLMVQSTLSVSNFIRTILLHQKLKWLIKTTISLKVTQPQSSTLSGARATVVSTDKNTKLRAQQVDCYQLCIREEERATLRWMGLKSISLLLIQRQHPYGKIQIQKTHRHLLTL